LRKAAISLLIALCRSSSSAKGNCSKCSGQSRAQSTDKRMKIELWRELREFLAIPNIASGHKEHSEEMQNDCAKCVEARD